MGKSRSHAMAASLGPWPAARRRGRLLPLTVGPALGDALAERSLAVARTGVRRSPGCVWAAVLAGRRRCPRTVEPHRGARRSRPRRSRSPVWAARGGRPRARSTCSPSAWGARSCSWRFSPLDAATASSNGSSYGDERRMLLRVPTPLAARARAARVGRHRRRARRRRRCCWPREQWVLGGVGAGRRRAARRASAVARAARPGAALGGVRARRARAPRPAGDGRPRAVPAVATIARLGPARVGRRRRRRARPHPRRARPRPAARPARAAHGGAAPRPRRRSSWWPPRTCGSRPPAPARCSPRRAAAGSADPVGHTGSVASAVDGRGTVRCGAAAEHDELRREVRDARYRYYVLSDLAMPDADFDARFRRARGDRGASTPRCARPDSPTQQVGAALDEAFPPFEHLEPMQSLDNVFGEADLRAWADRVARGLSAGDRRARGPAS